MFSSSSFLGLFLSYVGVVYHDHYSVAYKLDIG